MSDIIELNDDELEKVAGGKYKPNTGFSVEDAWDYKGEWLKKDNVVEDFAYTVFHAPRHVYSFIANKYWYNGNEAWYCGTCSIGRESLKVVEDPAKVHNELTYNKPF